MDYLDFENEEYHLLMPHEYAKGEEFYEQDYEDAVYKIFYTPVFFLDFFNVVMIQYPKNSEHSTLILAQNIPNNNVSYLMEFRHVYDKICSFLGEDIEKLGQIKKAEFSDEGWIGRNWKIDNQIMRLDTNEGNLQLIYNYKKLTPH